MKLLLISDVHFGKDMNYPLFGVSKFVSTFGSKFPSLFAKLIQKINESDLLVNIGDSIAIDLLAKDSKNDLETYRNFLKHFNDVKIPVKHLFGNHDTACMTRKELTELTKQSNTYFSFDLEGIHHIILDPQLIDSNFSIEDNQLSWLQKDLKKTNLMVIIYLHYRCDEQNMDDNVYFRDKKDKAFVRQKKELRKIFEDSGKVKLVFFGHTHYFHKENINDLLYVTVPSFTENDGTGEPCGSYLEVVIKSSIIDIAMKSIKLN